MKPNVRAAWVLEVEQDGADYFNQEISAVVLLNFTEYPRVFYQSQMGHPQGRVYYWKYISDSKGNLKHVAFIEDFKRNVLKPQLWQEGKVESDRNQMALS
ncbi:hypothetical protein Ct61P_14550 [Colletotrichum tofieldiae]|nr:hypothetical protein Ct61P_14550 [Colletotrichum tofieldiae]